MFLGSMCGVPQVLFCGYFIALSGTPLLVKIFAHTTSFTLYGFHAIITATFGHNRPKLRCNESYCYLQSPKKILDLLEMKEEGVGTDVAVLFIFFIAVQICMYVVLKFKYRHLQR